ncbi:MAG TPA: adenylate/guanylate cyclase domain-containing protein, partial [Spirochaetes bacterium]|nr:adenylate/guanylate cyclase domain-containing protein [Spirochaetota bacterium]
LIANYNETTHATFVLEILNKSELLKTVRNETDVKIKESVNYLTSWVEFSEGTESIDDFYRELKNQFEVDQKLAKKILDDLKKKKLIDYSEINIGKLDIPNFEALSTFASIPGQFKAPIFKNEVLNKLSDPEKKAFILEVYSYSKAKNIYIMQNKNNLTLNKKLRIAEILRSVHYTSARLYAQNIGCITTLINFAVASEKRGTPVYYTLAKDRVIKYLKEKTELSEDIIVKVLKSNKIKENKILEWDKDIIKINNPKDILKYSNNILITSIIIEELMNYFEDNDSEKYYYSTILAILRELEKNKFAKITISQFEQILKGISNDLLRLDSKNVLYTLVSIPEDKRKINVKGNTLNSYRIKERDIVIPIDKLGRVTINFQGEDGSFEHPDFGKYMMFSRGLANPVTGDPTSFEWEYFKNKVVCIGFNTSAGLGEGKDYFTTPYGTLYGIEIHANALYTVFEQDFIHSLPNVLFQIPGLEVTQKTYQPTLITILLIPGIIGLLVGLFYYFIVKKELLPAVKAGVIGLVAVFFLPSLLDVVNNGFTLSYVSSINLSLAVLLGFTLPRISILRGFLFFFIFLVVYTGSNIFYIFPDQKLDIPLLGGILTIITTFIGLMIYKLVTEEKEKRKIKGMFSKYVSPDLVHQLINTSKKLELGGEGRTLTVLFSDIRGFTKLSEGLDPQALVSHLNEYYTEMTRILQEFKGTLDKYIGDAIMAFWGAPLDIPNHALLACKASLEMMEQLDKMNANWPPELHINIGIGLNSGNMIVGNMGSVNRMDYTIMGDNVNLGSRVEGVNKMYTTEIIITEYTYEMVKDMVICRELDLIRVKGKEKPVKIYELLGINE